MAPTKVPKNPTKKPSEKPIEKPIMKMKKKSKKKNFENFSIYLYKLLRSITTTNVGISRKSMVIMNNFIYDMIERLGVEAGRLVSHGRRTTLSSREVQTAVKLLIPGELYKHANIEALKAIKAYHDSHEKS